ncbi:MAG: YeeE/YedE family protein [Deltaproteobacteria bacterium]|nr:YeeE/YedE family protein [Deltaproteobacteria bacterium]MCB9787997.1 YeeE/YedE family protein [Deltaproteobacteria bacterium]
MKRFALFLAFGLLFGFILSRVGATDFDAIAEMFLLTDLHLMGVIGVAVGVAGLGLAWTRRRVARGADLPTIKPKPVKPGLVLGAALFGAGWAVTGTCPGTGLAQLGEGKLMAVFTVAGIFAGTFLYRLVGPGLERRLATLRRPRVRLPELPDGGEAAART